MILVYLCVCHHLRLLWRLNTSLGSKFCSGSWTLSSCPAQHYFCPRIVVNFHYISQGQTVKILDHTSSEILFKILPKLFTSTVSEVCSSDRSALALTFEVPVKATLHWRSTGNLLWGQWPQCTLPFFKFNNLKYI